MNSGTQQTQSDNNLTGNLASDSTVQVPRVLIVVEGGVVQAVLADHTIQYRIKDWDEIEDDPESCLNDTHPYMKVTGMAPADLTAVEIEGVK